MMSSAARPSAARTVARIVVGASLVGLAVVAVPAVVDARKDPFATWTAIPASAMSETSAVERCRREGFLPKPTLDVVLAERRGDWVYLLLTSDAGEASCLVPAGAAEEERDGASWRLGHSTPDAPDPPTVGPDRIVEIAGTGGSIDGDGWVTAVDGHVGAEVIGVTVHTSLGETVRATVSRGRFAAWWPTKGPQSRASRQTWSYTVHLADGSTRPGP